MKLITNCLLLILALSLISCKDDITNPDISTFKFVTNENFILENERKWVLIYNSNNIVVAEDELENDIEIELEFNSDNSNSLYTVQIVSTLFDGKDEVCDIYTYTNVEPNIWKLSGDTKSVRPTRLGVNKLEFNDGSHDNFHFRHIQNLGNGNKNYSTNKIYMDQYYNPDILWICLHDDGERPYYKLIEDVSLNENFTISSSDLTQMECVIDYQIPQSRYSSIYINSDQTYGDDIKPNFRIYRDDQYESSRTITGYYPDNLFSHYRMHLFVYTDSYSEVMEFCGSSLPTVFHQIEIEEVVNNRSIQNFNSTITGEADFVKHFWENSNYDFINGNKIFRYYVFSPITGDYSFSAPSLPDFITELNPDFIDLKKLALKLSAYSKVDNSSNYSDYINREFINPEQKQNFSLKITKELFQ
jgi:hypothetical protein